MPTARLDITTSLICVCDCDVRQQRDICGRVFEDCRCEDGCAEKGDGEDEEMELHFCYIVEF